MKTKKQLYWFRQGQQGHYQQGTGKDDFVQIDLEKRELRHGYYGCPEYKGCSKTINLSKQFTELPGAVILKNKEFLPIQTLEEVEERTVGVRNIFYISLLNEYVHVENVDGSLHFSWDFYRDGLTMKDLVCLIPENNGDMNMKRLRKVA